VKKIMGIDNRAVRRYAEAELLGEEWNYLGRNDRIAKITRKYLKGELGHEDLKTTIKKYRVPGSLPSEQKAIERLLLPKINRLEKAVEAYIKKQKARRLAGSRKEEERVQEIYGYLSRRKWQHRGV